MAEKLYVKVKTSRGDKLYAPTIRKATLKSIPLFRRAQDAHDYSARRREHVVAMREKIAQRRAERLAKATNPTPEGAPDGTPEKHS